MSKPYNREEIKDNLIHEVSKEMGICETIRHIYDLVYDLPENDFKKQITEGLITTLLMAKKISDRLAFYAKKYQDPTGSWGEHLVRQRNNTIRSLQKKRGSRI